MLWRSVSLFSAVLACVLALNMLFGFLPGISALLQTACLLAILALTYYAGRRAWKAGRRFAM